jgi:hypothetical protein
LVPEVIFICFGIATDHIRVFSLGTGRKSFFRPLLPCENRIKEMSMPNCQVFAYRRRVEEEPQVATLIMKLLKVDAKMASDFTLVLWRAGGLPLRDPDF